MSDAKINIPVESQGRDWAMALGGQVVSFGRWGIKEQLAWAALNKCGMCFSRTSSSPSSLALG